MTETTTTHIGQENETQGMDTAAPVSNPRPDGVRHRLSRDQQRQVAQEYGDSAASVEVIARQFGVSEVSVYRILRKQGVSLRGRTSSAESADSRIRQAPASAATPRARRNGASGRRARLTSANGTSSMQFEIQFHAEQVVHAATIRDALRQVESSGASEVLAITRES